jgi:hypothetical protein
MVEMRGNGISDRLCRARPGWLQQCLRRSGARDEGRWVGAVVTVRVATADPPGRPGVAQIEQFARRVDSLSDGSIRVEPVADVPWTRIGDPPR